ncbi:MAG: hypothetical protein R3279_10135 [Putridiphycobacter sp.]|nr:hypothetical protein [Putridiphycobacter sp.]
MGHYIEAIIGSKPVNKLKAKELGVALIYESEFVIVPLIEENIHHFEIENNIDYEYFGDEITWDCTTVTVMAKLLGFENFVIASLKHWTFLGSYYFKSKKLKHEIDINSALSLLGVPNINASEFDYLNLNSYRNAEFYYGDTIIGHKNTVNIFKGTILNPDYNK